MYAEKQQPLTQAERPSVIRKLKRGIYITFEGPDGCGKSTQLDLLLARLTKEGYPVMKTKQPGGTDVGVGIRSILLHPSYFGKILPKTESMLFWTDRFQHYETIVKPALDNHLIILGDRDFDSSWAYQHYGRGIDANWMRHMQENTIGNLKPNMTLVFDGPVKIFLERSLQKNKKMALVDTSKDESRFEAEKIAFHERVRQGFLNRALEEPDRIKVIQATKTIQELHEETYSIVRKLLDQEQESFDEIYAVIDEKGNAIGKTTWSQVHVSGELHKAINIFLVRGKNKNELLLHKRSTTVAQPGLISNSVGGHVKIDQTEEEAAYTELFEELFHNMAKPDITLQFIGKFICKNKPLHNNELVHIYEGKYEGPVQPDPNEVEGEIFWMDVQDLKKDLKNHPEKYIPGLPEYLDYYLQHRK